MAHDHPHGHSHDHGHGHGHSHAHPHPHPRDPGPGEGHNQPRHHHLHSHMEPQDHADELRILGAQFIDGFRDAKDKAAYLRISGVPLEIDDPSGGPPLKLVDVTLTTEWQVGTASPSFGSRELAYLPFPGEMISERTNMGFVYVSLDVKRVIDLRDFLAALRGR